MAAAAAGRFHLPALTAHNGAGIPFAYPRLGSCAAALLHSQTGLARADVPRPLLFAVNVGAIGAFR